MAINPNEYKAIEASIKNGEILSINDDGYLIAEPKKPNTSTTTLSIQGGCTIKCNATFKRNVETRLTDLFKETQNTALTPSQKHCYKVITDNYCSKPISLGDSPTATSNISKELSNLPTKKNYYFEWDNEKKELTAHAYEVSLWTRLGLRDSSKCFVSIPTQDGSVKGLLVKNQEQASQLLTHLTNSNNHGKFHDILNQISAPTTNLKVPYKMTASFSSTRELTGFLGGMGDSNNYCFEWNKTTQQLTAHPYKPSIWTKLGFRSSTRFIQVSSDPVISIRLQNSTQMQALALHLYKLDTDNEIAKKAANELATKAISDKFSPYSKKLEESTQTATNFYSGLKTYKKDNTWFNQYTQFTDLLNQSNRFIKESMAPARLLGSDYAELRKRDLKLYINITNNLNENLTKLAELQNLITLYSQTSPEIKIYTKGEDPSYTWNTETHVLSNMMCQEKSAPIIRIIKRLKYLIKDESCSKALTDKLAELQIDENMGLHMPEEDYTKFMKHLLSNGPFGLFKALETLKPYLIAEKPPETTLPRTEFYGEDGFLLSSKSPEHRDTHSPSSSTDDSARGISRSSSLSTPPTPPSPTATAAAKIQDAAVYILNDEATLSILRLPEGLNKSQVFYNLTKIKKKGSDKTTYTLTPKKLEDGKTANLRKSSKIFVCLNSQTNSPGIFFGSVQEAETFSRLIRKKTIKDRLITALKDFASPFDTIMSESKVTASRYNQPAQKRYLS